MARAEKITERGMRKDAEICLHKKWQELDKITDWGRRKDKVIYLLKNW